MKKIFLIILAVIAFEAQAMKPSDVRAVNANISKTGNMLHVEFDILTTNFSSNQRVKLIPVIYNGDNSWKTLEAMTLVGRKRDIYDMRANADNDGTVREHVKRKNQPAIKYYAAVPYEEWMQYVSLSVDMIFEGCCTQTDTLMQNASEPQLTYYEPTPYFDTTPLHYELSELEQYSLNNPLLYSMEDYPNRYDILTKDRSKDSIEIIFTVGSAKIDMKLQHNKEMFEALGKAFRLIDEDPNATLKHIMIAGYASPEGSLALNTKLAQQRAFAVKESIKSLLTNHNDDVFELFNGRENWNGLREQVENSNMPEKNEILEIIDAHTMEQEIRKIRLKVLRGGAPYRYMLDNFYPALRSAGYVQVYYEINRAASAAADSPANRSVTAINKAQEYMAEEKFDEALILLTEFKDDPRTWNIIGVCRMMQGQYNEADTYFTKAVFNGDENAAKNKEELNWLRKVKF